MFEVACSIELLFLEILHLHLLYFGIKIDVMSPHSFVQFRYLLWQLWTSALLVPSWLRLSLLLKLVVGLSHLIFEIGKTLPHHILVLRFPNFKRHLTIHKTSLGQRVIEGIMIKLLSINIVPLLLILLHVEHKLFIFSI